MWRLIEHIDRHPTRVAATNACFMLGQVGTLELNLDAMIKITIWLGGLVSLAIGVTTLYRKWFGQRKIKRLLMSEVMIIDDSEEDLFIFSRAFYRAGCNVVKLQSFDDALEILRGARRFDLVILDANMPGQDCARMFRQIKIERPAVAVVVFSGIISAQLVESVSRVGIAVFVQKPQNDAEQFAHDLIETLKIGKPV